MFSIVSLQRRFLQSVANGIIKIILQEVPFVLIETTKTAFVLNIIRPSRNVLGNKNTKTKKLKLSITFVIKINYQIYKFAKGIIINSLPVSYFNSQCIPGIPLYNRINVKSDMKNVYLLLWRCKDSKHLTLINDIINDSKVYYIVNPPIVSAVTFILSSIILLTKTNQNWVLNDAFLIHISVEVLILLNLMHFTQVK